MKHRPLKRFGQNFLTDPTIKSQIVLKSKLDNNIHVIEIGPGKGFLTSELIKNSKTLTAIEIDRNLASELIQNYSSDTVKIIEGDFLDINLEELFSSVHEKEPIWVVANIPYYITTPIILKCLKFARIQKLVIMVQKELAERICAKPGTKQYNGFSVLLQTFAKTKMLISVNRKAFFPVPKVDSAVIEIAIHRADVDFDKFSKFLKVLFTSKRKTLKNNLLQSYDLIKLEEMEMELGVDLGIRAEALEKNIIIDIYEYLTS